MGTVTILEETTINPITLMGKRAGICYGSDITNDKKNYERGLDCLKSNHGRILEYVNIEMLLDGYSARVIREWYTHLGGSPTRLQASTRYINYENFDVVIPTNVKKNKEALELYLENIEQTQNHLRELLDMGIPREDVSMLLPLGMCTKIVDKRNLRNLIDMSHQRMCSKAYWEYRQLMMDICNALSPVSDEWNYIVSHYFKPKCEVLGYCTEKKGCKRKERK